MRLIECVLLGGLCLTHKTPRPWLPIDLVRLLGAATLDRLLLFFLLDQEKRLKKHLWKRFFVILVF